jgi:hypothetical protein
MHAVWIDAGNDPEWEKLARYGIRWLYFPLSDPPADVRRRLLDVHARGLVGGVYSAWNWYAEPSGKRYASIVDQGVRELDLPDTSTFPKVMFDDERHEPATISELLTAWRTLRPTKDTAWTMESMQGGWMPPAFVKTVVDCRVRVVPQCYSGNMQAVDTLAAARDLTKRGFFDALVSPFYDAAQLPIGWDGFAFTQGRLP